MTTTIVGEMRKGSGSVKQGGNFDLVFEYTGTALVVSNDKNTTRQDVLYNTPGLPIVGITQLAGTQAICSSLTANRREENPLYWDVDIVYQTNPQRQSQDPSNPSDDPTTWKPRFRVSFTDKEQVMTEDKSDPPKEYVNSAGQRFETPLTEKKQIAVIPFTQFENASLTITQIMNRNNHTNASAFLGAEAETLLLNIMGAEKGYYGQVQCWKIDYQLSYDPDTWDLKILDVGSQYLDGDGNLVPYLDKDGHRIIGNLDGAGGKVAEGDPPEELTFKQYETLSFSFIRT